MNVKCQCQHCNGEIEFDAVEFEFSSETSHRRLGQTINCPHCQQPTQIYMNKAEFTAPKKPGLVADLKEIWTDPKWLVRQDAKQKALRMTTCADCGAQMSRRALWCPACGSIQRSLFGLLFEIACTMALVWGVFAGISWLILKLIETLTAVSQ